MNNVTYKLGLWVFVATFMAGIIGAFSAGTVMAASSTPFSLSLTLGGTPSCGFSSNYTCNTTTVTEPSSTGTVTLTVARGQSVPIYASAGGGVPFSGNTYKFSWNPALPTYPNANVVCPSSVKTGSESCSFVANATASYTLTAKDSTSQNTISITADIAVVPPLSSVGLSDSNSVLYQNQYQTLTANAVGGAADNATFYVYNSTGALVNVTNPTYEPTSPFTYTFQQNASWGTGTFTANVVVIDTATGATLSKNITYTVYSDTPIITIALPSSNITTYNGAEYGPITVSLPTVGNQLVLNVAVTGNYANGNVIPTTTYTTNALQNWTTFYIGPDAGNYVITASTAGNGNYVTTANVNNATVTYSPVTNTVVINQATLSATDVLHSETNPLASTANFTGTPTLGNQVQWTLTADGNLYATVNSVATYATSSVGTHSLVFSNPGNNNYLPYTLNAVITESSSGSGGIVSSPPVTTIAPTPLAPSNVVTNNSVNTNAPSNTVQPANTISTNGTVNNTKPKPVTTTVQPTTTVAPTNHTALNTSAAVTPAVVSSPAGGIPTWLIALVIIIILALIAAWWYTSGSKKGGKKN